MSHYEVYNWKYQSLNFRTTNDIGLHIVSDIKGNAINRILNDAS